MLRGLDIKALKAFNEISVDPLNTSAWKRVEQGKWFQRDAIHFFEARTLSKACDRHGNVSNLIGFKVFTLGDNLAVTLAYACRRATDFQFPSQIRQISAVGLVERINLIFRSIPSELNVAEFDIGNLGTVWSSSHQIRQKQCPFELPASTPSEATLSVASVEDKRRVALVCGLSLMDTTYKRVIPPASTIVSQPSRRFQTLVPMSFLSKIRTVKPLTMR